MKYKSCIRVTQFALFMVSGLYVDGITLAPCCFGSGTSGVRIPGITFADTPRETMRNFAKLRKSLLDEATIPAKAASKNRLTSLCEKCPFYQEAEWQPSKRIQVVTFAMYPAPCQSKCRYCTICIHNPIAKNDRFDEELHGPLYEHYFELLQYARRNKLIAHDATYEVGSGEISIHPYKDKILDFVKGQTTVFLTNGFVYNEKIAAHLSTNPSSCIYCSLDAGTAETWRRVKGVDTFDMAMETLAKYCAKAAQPKQIVLKYIILPDINTNQDDYEAVVQILKRLGLRRLVIAGDVTMNKQEQLDKTIDAAGHLLATLQRNGIEAGWDAFNPNALAESYCLSQSTQYCVHALYSEIVENRLVSSPNRALGAFQAKAKYQ